MELLLSLFILIVAVCSYYLGKWSNVVNDTNFVRPPKNKYADKIPLDKLVDANNTWRRSVESNYKSKSKSFTNLLDYRPLPKPKFSVKEKLVNWFYQL